MNQPLYTYLENRRCLNCGSPIADQVHKTKKFCAKETYSDGTTKNCKDQYWSEQRREAKSIFKAMEIYHQSCSESLHQLYGLDLPEITMEHLEHMGIDLGRSAVHRVFDNEHRFFYFGFFISVNTITHKIQIHPHNEKLF
ncbi:hypothetical protein [Lacibacter sediminis]|uniref:Uncharacterized protein n=1 Tax=Lacibacter sediminis TaxID=2760713 RepID=A0A7G5XLV6_9BACT|nr:hypothetical protein [Lacibacter sediminis]QNA46459.1 hypothetical protein H4075_09890 [Lacibacter sediminis]